MSMNLLSLLTNIAIKPMFFFGTSSIKLQSKQVNKTTRNTRQQPWNKQERSEVATIQLRSSGGLIRKLTPM